jgi:hypothetical protein
VRALDSVQRLWDEQRGLRAAMCDVQRRIEAEVARLARTKHRQLILEHLYWDPDEKFTVGKLAELFRAKTTTELAEEVGTKQFETTCLLCGAGFRIWLASRSARNALLRETATANPKWRSCPVCDRERLKELGRLRKKKGQKLTAGHRAAYRRYLQSPQWKERRDKAVKKAGAKCALCSSKKRLNVHHRDYRRIGRERAADLIVLCESCHSTFHDHGHTH